MKAFVVSALRGARWPPRHEAVKDAFIGNGVNPRTGKKCKLHRCAKCRGEFPQNGVQADHTEPVIGPEGFVDWNTFISRLFVEKEGYTVLCKKCHSLVTLQERFDLTEDEAIIRQKVVAFGKLTPAAQNLTLTQLGADAGTNATIRKFNYYHHLLKQ